MVAVVAFIFFKKRKNKHARWESNCERGGRDGVAEEWYHGRAMDAFEAR
jgi:hypothetical protein